MLFNPFKKKKKNRPFVTDYTPIPDEYAQLDVPSELRALYRYVKIVFLLLFPIGIGLYFKPFTIFIIAVLFSCFISIRYISKFQESLNTRLRFVVFLTIPPVCLSIGYVFGLMLFSQIAKISQG